MAMGYIESEPKNLRERDIVEKFSDATRRELRRQGFILFPIMAASIGSLIDQGKPLGYVKPSEILRHIVPPSCEVAINPKGLVIPNSNNKQLGAQLAMIGEYNNALNIPGARASMAHASVYCQLDFAYREKTRKPLLTNFFARTIDQTFGRFIADVGRHRADHQLFVDDWLRGSGGLLIWAVPVVVPVKT